MILPCPALPKLPPRDPAAHKGNYGTALLVGGSRGMAGAIAMAGLAASRAGAGLVRLAVPDRCLETVAGFSPTAMTVPLPDDSSGRIDASWGDLESHASPATCLAVGPGIGQSRELQHLLKEIARHAPCPLVLDADGLNNLSQFKNWSRCLRQPTVITPHPGEWSRLSGVSPKDRPAQIAAAIELASCVNQGPPDPETSSATDSLLAGPQAAGTPRLIIVLKGHASLVTDGRTEVYNDTGTPAMATGGSGDVLTGVITALICQGLSPRDAAHLAVKWHGLAGEIAQQRLGSHVVLPTELIDALPEALAKLQDG